MTKEGKIPLTKAGLDQLQKELNKLVQKERPEAIERLVDSRKSGDMDEDNEETQAKQNFYSSMVVSLSYKM